MNGWFHPRPASTDPPTLMPDKPLSAAEVRELWSFVHGDIMVGGIREHLRRAFGLCPRHTWGYAVVEIELWLSGPEPRGGHIPFDVGILYDDLLEHTSAILSATHGASRHGLQELLTPHASCRVCDSLTPSSIDVGGLGIGYAGSNSVELTKEANTLTFTSQWCTRTHENWINSVCPACAGFGDGEAREQVRLCRRHLAEAGPIENDVPEAVATRLDELRGRLQRMVDSMTQNGPPATVADDASVIETLGWFAGWEFPIAITDR